MDDEIIDLEEEPEEILSDTGDFKDKTPLASAKEIDNKNDHINLNTNQKKGINEPNENKNARENNSNLNQNNHNEEDNNLNKQNNHNEKDNNLNKQNNKNLSPFVKYPNFINKPNENNIKNHSTNNDPNRISQILNKHSNIPKVPLLKNQSNEEKTANQNVENNINGNQKKESTFQASFSLLDLMKKKKMIIIISLIAIISLGIILLIVMVGGLNTSDDLGKNTSGYINGEMSEEELLAELEYYGYCNSESSCKKQGAYKFFKELKSVYDEYQSKYDVSINTSLILETINYYDNATDNFDTYDKTDEELEDEKNIVSVILNNFDRLMKEKKQLDENIGDIKILAEAQTEYVKETCKENGKKQTKYYYQISFDKYVSYLKYGTSSTHPNYSNKPVEIENDICEGPKNDYIETDYNQNESEVTTDSTTGNTTVTGSGKGVDIANYALQFVGNRYVYGGTSLTDGVDCSGFTMKVMEHFGISIPHSSRDQAHYGTNLGTDVSQAQPGDLIVYDGHVAIYLGDNSIVHASNPKSGIKVSKDASYRPIVAIVRLWG